MRQLVHEVFINCQPARIWRLFEKHLEHPELAMVQSDPGEIQQAKAEALSEQRAGIGTRTRWHYTYGRKPFDWDDVVTVWEPGKRVGWKTTSSWDMEDSFTITPEKNGARVTHEMEYRLPYGPLGAVYGRVILEPKMRKHLQGVLLRMKRLCEEPFSAEAGT